MIFADDTRNTTRIVMIDVVDIEKNEIHCSGKDGGRFTIPIPISNGFYRIPRTGEYWMIRRQNLTTWLFEGVVDQDKLYGNVAPQDGDSVVNASNNFIISANAMFLNNDPLGTPAYEEFDISGATTSVIELQAVPIPSSVQVFNNGLLIALSGIIIGEQSLLFETPLSAGKVAVFYMKLPQR